MKEQRFLGLYEILIEGETRRRRYFGHESLTTIDALGDFVDLCVYLAAPPLRRRLCQKTAALLRKHDEGRSPLLQCGCLRIPNSVVREWREGPFVKGA
jgi:hypothetical protein